LHGFAESAVQRDTIRISAICEGRYRRALCYFLKPCNGRTVSGLHRMHNKNTCTEAHAGNSQRTIPAIKGSRSFPGETPEGIPEGVLDVSPYTESLFIQQYRKAAV